MIADALAFTFGIIMLLAFGDPTDTGYSDVDDFYA